MSQINSNTKDDFQVVLLLSCFVGHPVGNGIYRMHIIYTGVGILERHFTERHLIERHVIDKNIIETHFIERHVIQGVPRNMTIARRFRRSS